MNILQEQNEIIKGDEKLFLDTFGDYIFLTQKTVQNNLNLNISNESLSILQFSNKVNNIKQLLFEELQLPEEIKDNYNINIILDTYLLLDIYINKKEDLVNNKLPNIYISNNNKILITNYKKIIYKIKYKNTDYKVICHRVYNVRAGVLYVPCYIVKYNNIRGQVNLQMKRHTFEFNNFQFEIECPLITKEGVKYLLAPKFLCPKKKYPFIVYLYAAYLYCKDCDLSYRQVSNIIKSTFNLKNFNKSTVLRVIRDIKNCSSKMEEYKILFDELHLRKTPKTFFPNKQKTRKIREKVHNFFIYYLNIILNKHTLDKDEFFLNIYIYLGKIILVNFITFKYKYIKYKIKFKL
jgi:hypothetical protein